MVTGSISDAEESSSEARGLVEDETVEDGTDNSEEINPLVASDVEQPESVLERLMLEIDQQVGVKVLMRVWGPRLEFLVRLMLVATFLDDSFHTVMQFSQSATQIGEQDGLQWLMAKSPKLVGIGATVSLAIGLVAQFVGSLCLLALLWPNASTKALIGWVIAQPVLYAQLSNAVFVAESLSLIGGLLMLQAHLVSHGARTQLLGRLLLPAAYLHHAGRFLFSQLTLNETNSVAMYVSSLSMVFLSIIAVLVLLIGCALVAAGLKSRTIALLLALLNLGFVCYQHPFFLFVWRKGGEWQYDEKNMPIPDVALPDGVLPIDLDQAQVYDLHRYYFFLGLSTSGALLLLTQYGPGEIAVQKNEVLVPAVPRTRDWQRSDM